jgi:isoquinoline 1-oxidoreductase alpha subunit
MAEYTLSVNGRSHTVEASPDMPLLWVLRDRLKLTGTKFGCGQGLCGACTVHLGGEPVRSCVTPVSDVGTQRITTIEGLDPHGAHPLQKAWIEADVSQCGYCQTGQIMTAAALLAKRPKPTDRDIDQAMGENVCRCGTYLRIREAIHRAAGQGKEVAS